MKLFLLSLAFPCLSAAQVCGNFDLHGAYGFQLSGISTIAGEPKPIAAIGRLDFGDEGKIGGTSSVNFGGLFLGNPVTGTYTSASDCSITFELQDDSGAWQHFRGTLAPGGATAQFQQTDPGTGGHGLLARLPASCGAELVSGTYTVMFNGQRTATAADGRGKLTWKSGDAVNTGTYDVASDCFVDINFGAQLRGVIVDNGRRILAVQTDPLKIAVATFTAQ